MSRIYEVTLVSGDAEAAMLICAQNIDQAKLLAKERVYDKDVCWEENPDSTFQIVKVKKCLT